MDGHAFPKFTLLKGVLLAIAIIAAPAIAGYAQDYGTGQQGAPEAQTQFSNEDLNAFAAAAVRVNEIVAQRQPEIADAGSQEEAARLQAEMDRELLIAVEDEGLSVQKFNDISMASRSNPQLAARIEQLIAEEVQ